MGERRRSKPRNNVYTVLVAVALLALVFGVAYVWLQITAMTGQSNPFESLGALPVWEHAAGVWADLGRAVSFV